MALNTFKRNCLTPLHFKELRIYVAAGVVRAPASKPQSLACSSDFDQWRQEGDQRDIRSRRHLAGGRHLRLKNKQKQQQVLQQEAYLALLMPRIRPSLGLLPNIGEDLSEIRPNRNAKFHADR